MGYVCGVAHCGISMRFFCLLFLGYIGWIVPSSAQVAPDCVTAIPICNNTPVTGGTNGYGTDDFHGAVKSGCLEPTATGAIESNSAWYRFRTGASGQLGFDIASDVNEDWDFALYRSDDCGSLGEPVRCNFFDNRDKKAYQGVGAEILPATLPACSTKPGYRFPRGRTII